MKHPQRPLLGISQVDPVSSRKDIDQVAAQAVSQDLDNLCLMLQILASAQAGQAPQQPLLHLQLGKGQLS